MHYIGGGGKEAVYKTRGLGFKTWVAQYFFTITDTPLVPVSNRDPVATTGTKWGWQPGQKEVSVVVCPQINGKPQYMCLPN